MTLRRRRFLQLAAGAVAIPVASRMARAQAYPTRPITLIVPFPPGGSTDVAARIAADHMSRTLGQQVVIQNVSGAGGTTGSARAMRAEPDGYTILMGQMGTHAASVALYPNLAYKPDEDFAPIGQVASFPFVIATRKDFPPNNVKEFITYVKANDTKLNQGHAGVGSMFFTSCLLLNSLLGTNPTLVPFTGGAPAMNALVGGQTDFMCADVVTGGPQYPDKIKISGGHNSSAQSGAAERAERGGGRAAGIPGDGMEWPIRTQGDAQANRRPTGRSARQGARRSRNPQASRCAWRRNPGQGQPRTCAVPRAGQERNRALVANHQGRECEDELAHRPNPGWTNKRNHCFSLDHRARIFDYPPQGRSGRFLDLVVVARLSSRRA